MVKRIAPIGIVSLVLSAACTAVCQNVSQFLPDAPSVKTSSHERNPNAFIKDASPPLEFGTKGDPAGPMRPNEFATSPKGVFGRKEPDSIFRRYLYPSVRERQPGDRSSTSGSLMDRATYAASCVFFTRDGSGKVRLNAPYFLRALTAVAADTASSPYWRRTVSGPFGDFGSTVGNDAGMSLLHEFGPGIQQAMKSHTPEFVSKIEEHIGHN